MGNTIEKASKWIMNTYSPLPIVITHGKGSILFDDNNKPYVDFTSGIGVSCLGYGNKKIKEAINKQAEKLTHISNIFYNEPAAKLAKKLCKAANMKKVFFSNSGAEANEGAIKVARKYSYDKYGENRHTILTLKQSFHGRTITTLAATGQDHFHTSFFPFTQGFKYVERNNVGDLISKIDDTVCAIMMEPIQGEGGVYPLTKEFVDEVKKISIEKDIIVIFDEVQCGVGRTGLFLGHSHYNIEPDIITMAKGLGGGVPIGGFLCNEKTSKVLQAGDHGSTYGANPLVCSVAYEVIKQVTAEGFIDEVAKKGEYIIDTISKWDSDNIIDVRGKGLLIGIQIKEDVKKIQSKALNEGLLVLSAGDNTIRLLPPLTITYDEIEVGLNILKKILMEG